MAAASLTIALIRDVFFDAEGGERLVRRLAAAKDRGAGDEVVMLADGSELTPADFPQLALAGAESASPPPSPVIDTPEAGQSTTIAAESPVAQPRHMVPAPIQPVLPGADIAQFPHYGATWILDERGDVRNFDALEEEVIRFALDHYRGRMSEVARRLGIGRSTLYRKLKDYGIESHSANAA